MAKCSFNCMWLKDFSWVQEVPNDKFSASCSLCNKKLNLSNMGRRAITSHQNTIGHKKKEQSVSESSKLPFFKPSNNNAAVIETDVVEIQNDNDKITPTSLPVVPASTSLPSGIKRYLLKEDITKSEILWCLQIIMNHRSLRSAEKDSKLFSRLFKDSEIAQGIQLGRDKISYYLLFGIAPFFKDIFIKNLLLLENFVIGFDESLNKVSQKQQMDLNIRYWCLTSNEVKTRYLNSVFLGRSCSKDLLEAFQEGTKPLDLKKIVQVSMDGPNVNLKFFKELQSLNNKAPEDPEILNIGSCGLHSVNLSFKTGAQSTNWEIFDFMRSIYYVFKDSPARRALYTLYTKSKEFPKKFCAIRWLENSQVAERALSIIPHLKIFIEKVEKEKSAPTSKSYISIKKHIVDSLLPAKLAFFHSVATDFESFLTAYQTDIPLVPFLFSDLTNLLLRQLRRFIKADALKEGNILNVDFENVENFLPAKKIDVGISSLCHIKKSKASEGQLNTFYKDVRKFLIVSVKKLKERSPLIYALTRSVSCFDPMVASNEKLFDLRLTKLLLILCEKNWMTPTNADKAKSQLKHVCTVEENILKLKSYKRNERVDKFWFNLLINHTNPCEEAILLIKIIMVLSHGNSNIERGFSINKDCLWDNMKEETLISRRIVYDNIQANGGLDSFEISKQLILNVRNSRAKFEEYKEKKQKEERELRGNLKRKKETEDQMKELEAKKLRIFEAAKKDSLLVEEEIASLKLLQKNL